jgi:hypothetical protein
MHYGSYRFKKFKFYEHLNIKWSFILLLLSIKDVRHKRYETSIHHSRINKKLTQELNHVFILAMLTIILKLVTIVKVKNGVYNVLQLFQ